LHRHVVPDLRLAGQSPVVFHLFAAEEDLFGGQYVAASLDDLRAALAAFTAATAGGQRGKDCAGKEQFCGFHVVYLEVYWLGCVIAARIFRSCLLQMRA